MGRFYFQRLKFRVRLLIAFRVDFPGTAETYLQFCFDEVERVLRENAGSVAALIVEPLVQGAAGILVHPTGYLKHLRTLTKKV